jgi:exodeoxyribonuclease V gamma subunit
MPLYLDASASLESLAHNLSVKLAAAGRSVFDPHYIVTQTDGMNNWLKLQIAGHLGIAANCRFLKPNDLINQLYYLLGGKYGDLLSPNNLCWLLYKIMGTRSFMARYPYVADYYNNTDNPEARRLALAQQVADRFDQYQIYRPEMIRDWNDKAVTDLDRADWQQYLWVHARAACGDSLPDKTRLGSHILDALKRIKVGVEQPNGRLPEVHLFGISILTEYHLQILYELSSHVDVHFHILNPAPDTYWFDERSEKQLSLWEARGYKVAFGASVGNALLTGWGKVVQDMFRLLFRYDDFLNGYSEVPAVLPEPDSLLHKLQLDIHTAATTPDRHTITAANLADHSITISSCYTIVREVEALYNYLVHLIDKGAAKLSPRDIVVMVNNVDKYAPYIKAVFSNAPYYFRYTIADESLTGGDSITDALIALLTITEGSFRAEEVLQILELSSIRMRFGITDMAHIRRLINAANIRFGIDGHEEDDTRFVSWRQGLRRIMYGICMSGSPEYGESEDYFYPLDIIEGRNAQDAVRFCHFAEQLMDGVKGRGGRRTIAAWAAYTERLLQDFITEPADDTYGEYSAILGLLADYGKVEQYMDDAIPYEVFSRSFVQRLSGTQRSGLYANGGITFCSMIPMRSIPFKVVALLGMGADMPRRERVPSFDLISRDPRLGDRNIKENDKHLFLETILSAKDYLYISYTGRNVKDNTALPPSVLVDELLDYIESGLDNEKHSVHDSLVTQHPMLGFSHLYNREDKKLFNYLIHAQKEPPIILKPEANELADINELTLDELIRFFHNPFKAYYNRRLGIYYDESDELLAETELFSLDNLQKWSLKNDLLKLDPVAIEKMRETQLRTGRLPLRNMSQVYISQLEELVSPVRAQYLDCISSHQASSKQFSIDIAGCVLAGTIHSVYDDRQVYTSWSKNPMKHKIDAYIRHLAGVVAGVLAGTSFISATDGSVMNTLPLTPAQAVERLEKLIDLYRLGHKSIMPFCAQLAWDKTDDIMDAMEWPGFVAGLEKWINNYDNPCTDPYIMREYNSGYWQESRFAQYKSVHRQVVSLINEIFAGHI